MWPEIFEPYNHNRRYVQHITYTIICAKKRMYVNTKKGRKNQFSNQN